MRAEYEMIRPSQSPLRPIICGQKRVLHRLKTKGPDEGGMEDMIRGKINRPLERCELKEQCQGRQAEVYDHCPNSDPVGVIMSEMLRWL